MFRSSLAHQQKSGFCVLLMHLFVVFSTVCQTFKLVLRPNWYLQICEKRAFRKESTYFYIIYNPGKTRNYNGKF